METQNIEFKRVDSVPPRTKCFVMGGRTLECFKSLGEMRIDDVFHLPIENEVPEEHRRETSNKYHGSIQTAARKLHPKEFKISRRYNDIFVQRIE